MVRLNSDFRKRNAKRVVKDKEINIINSISTHHKTLVHTTVCLISNNGSRLPCTMCFIIVIMSRVGLGKDQISENYVDICGYLRIHTDIYFRLN